MSKAFTKESDVPEPELGSVEPDLRLPPGAKNYVTPAGAAALREELRRLSGTSGPAPEDQRRIRYLQRRIDTEVVVDPTVSEKDRVRFGATVSVRDEDGKTRTYRIVGVDEADPKRGWISWVSPVAQALLNGALGDAVTLQTPQGEEELEILRIE